MGNIQNQIKNDTVLRATCYLASPGRDLFSQLIGFQFGAILGTDTFGDTPPINSDQNPYPYSGLSLLQAGSHASLWADQIPELRIYVVIAV